MIMDKDYKGWWIFGLGEKAKFLRILRFPRFLWNQPLQEKAREKIIVFYVKGIVLGCKNKAYEYMPQPVLENEEYKL